MTTERMGGEGAVLAEELKRAELAVASAKGVILVEGESDRKALDALALLRGRDLQAEGVEIIATTGATNFARFLQLLGPIGHGERLAGLCDEGERSELHHALVAAGASHGADRLEDAGFFVCVRDLEDELIRALGAERMLTLIESQGHLRRFRSFQNQPAQRQKTVEQQIWRWLGNHKIRYAELMVESLDSQTAPTPLERVLAAI